MKSKDYNNNSFKYNKTVFVLTFEIGARSFYNKKLTRVYGKGVMKARIISRSKNYVRTELINKNCNQNRFIRFDATKEYLDSHNPKTLVKQFDFNFLNGVANSIYFELAALTPYDLYNKVREIIVGKTYDINNSYRTVPQDNVKLLNEIRRQVKLIIEQDRMKLNAEQYLKKYGSFTINAACKALENMTNNTTKDIII